MAEKLKMLMDIFGKVTFGVLIAATVFISLPSLLTSFIIQAVLLKQAHTVLK